MTRLVDLDSIAGLECAWSELERRRELRDADPELREAIMRRCDYLSSDKAAPILVALDQVHPALVLEIHFTVLASATALAAVRNRQENRSP